MKSQVLIILLFFYASSVAQKSSFSCSYNNSKTSNPCDVISANSDNNIYDKNVKNKIKEILRHVGLPQNFILVKCDGADNAIALTDPSGSRYIIIDEQWMSSIASNNWFIIGVLAHEIGHHLSGHTIKPTNSLSEKRKRELEADQFSGFILKKMGATYNQSLTALNLLVPNDFNDSNSTHPTRSKRVSAVKKGFNGNANDFESSNDIYVKSSEQLYNDAISIVSLQKGPNYFKYTSSKNIYKAISIHESIIKKNPNYGASLVVLTYLIDELINRKELKVDYYLTAINYAERANEVFYNIHRYASFEVYNNVGYFYNYLATNFVNRQYFDQAISNLNNAISINPYHPKAYHNRGIAYFNLGNNFRLPTKPQACNDFLKACQLGEKSACNTYNNTGCR